ncbi:Hypothetical protein Minf_0935 [Methylacidiphilum infernorum V4]|uniref:Uncharacterized protein n=1 Tax=Methylacidiphilum infernorum (isolate V4) TaxID=481448 RepID=B3DUI7_METI4|nr:Hypothetical protein Minf_0935 [Methylacidiphilum infernorum V4]
MIESIRERVMFKETSIQKNDLLTRFIEEFKVKV